MASRNTVGADTAPQLVVKIIGSKLIKYYTEEPEREKEANSNASQENINLPEDTESKAITPHPDEEDLATQTKPTAGGRESSPWPVLKQAPDRPCVTAPPGYPTLPCTDRKTPALRSAPHTAQRLHSRELGAHSAPMDKEKSEGAIHQEEEKDIDHLFTMLCEELKDWRKEALKNIETELQEIDPAHSGTADRFLLTQVFFRNEVPLKLTTLQLLLNTFSNSACPEEIYYTDLLSLISDATLNEEHQEKTELDVDDVLHRSEAVSLSDSAHSEAVKLSDSAHSEAPPPAGLGLPTETEIWLQRFQKMEEAMWMCDTQNSGFLDKDKARRLIQNYNLIFNLNLSPLKIDGAFRGSQTGSRVHLDSLLHMLKEL